MEICLERLGWERIYVMRTEPELVSIKQAHAKGPGSNVQAVPRWWLKIPILLLWCASQHYDVHGSPTISCLVFLTFYLFCAFQVLLSWIICWLLATHHWVQTQHLDHWGCFRNRGKEGERERGMNESRTPPFGCTKTVELRENLYLPG